MGKREKENRILLRRETVSGLNMPNGTERTTKFFEK
jgi:hypothetical protein